MSNNNYELEIAPLRAELARVRQGAADANNDVCQILGAPLGYPLGEDGKICVGDHVAETLAAEAVKLIDSLRGQLIEAQASISVLQRTAEQVAQLKESLRGLEWAAGEAAKVQADERARRDRALDALADAHLLVENIAGYRAGTKTAKQVLTLLTSAIRILTGQDEEERREEAKQCG